MAAAKDSESGASGARGPGRAGSASAGKTAAGKTPPAKPSAAKPTSGKSKSAEPAESAQASEAVQEAVQEAEPRENAGTPAAADPGKAAKGAASTPGTGPAEHSGPADSTGPEGPAERAPRAERAEDTDRTDRAADGEPDTSAAGHADSAAHADGEPKDVAPATPSVWEERAARSLAFLRRRVTGEYEVDEFGFDPDLNDTVLMGILRPLYDKYFRVEVSGIGNVPSEGGALLVGNHSGTVPIDALMTQVALLDEAGRHLRMLAADLVFTLPFVGEMSRKMGHTLACNPDAERLLRAGEIVGVWPEGFKGVGKPFSQRYRLQRFGRGGFVSAALRTGVPIVPVSIVGAEEIYPKIADIKPLARLLGLPYFPVTPTFPLLGPLGLVPLPTKWHIAFGEPIPTDRYDAGAAEDPMLVFDLTDQIRETIQDTLYRLLLQRRSVFF